MKTILLSLSIFLLLLACQSQETITNTEETIESNDISETLVTRETPTPPKPQNLCFERVEGQDRIELKLTIDNNVVTGEFNYLPYEKDQAIGNVEGILEGNTIKASYKYDQEGMESVENLIITLSDQEVAITHAGPVIVDGEKYERQKGEEYTEKLPKSSCS